MERENLNINESDDRAEYNEIYTEDKILSFICQNCFNVHPLTVQQTYTYNNRISYDYVYTKGDFPGMADIIVQ